MRRFGRLIENSELSSITFDHNSNIKQLIYDFGVICLRFEEKLTPDRFLEIARCIGVPKEQLLRDHRLSGFPEISIISNKQKDVLGSGKKIVLGSHWHTDDSYLSKPTSFTLLHSNVIPGDGMGDTVFADTQAAWSELDSDFKKNILKLRAVHKYQSRRNKSLVPSRSKDEKDESSDVVHPLVRVLPESNKECIYLNPNRIDHILDLPFQEGDKILDQLLDFCTSPRFIYKHRWKVGDVVIWDNRRSMHKVEYNYGNSSREMMRILLEGSKP
tara:strand:+ start:13512 stop:14327 length:816 start_codon:yes stop_codon:yes gene_type:complete